LPSYYQNSNRFIKNSSVRKQKQQQQMDCSASSLKRVEVVIISDEEEAAITYRDAVNKVTVGKLPDGQRVVMVYMKNNFTAIMDDCPATANILKSHRLRYAEKGRGVRVKRVVAFSRSPDHVYKSIFVHLLVFAGADDIDTRQQRHPHGLSSLALSHQLVEHINGDQLDLTRANLRRKVPRAAKADGLSLQLPLPLPSTAGIITTTVINNPIGRQLMQTAHSCSSQSLPHFASYYYSRPRVHSPSHVAPQMRPTATYPTANPQTVAWTGVGRHESMKAWLVQWKEKKKTTTTTTTGTSSDDRYLMELFYDQKYGTSRLSHMAAMVFYKHKLEEYESPQSRSQQRAEMVIITTTTTTTTTTATAVTTPTPSSAKAPQPIITTTTSVYSN